MILRGEGESGRNEVDLVEDEDDVLPIWMVVGKVVQRRREGRTPES